MQATAKSNLVLTDFSSLHWLNAEQCLKQHAEFYQQIRCGLVKGEYKRVLIEFGRKLIRLAQNAYMLRQIERLEEVSQVLMNYPIPSYQSAGLYYHALVLKRKGQIIQAKNLLERVVDTGSYQYRTQALLSLGTLTLERGDILSALSFYLDSIKLSAKKDLVTSVQTFKMIAVLKAIDGDHCGAVADLEKLFPAVRMVSVYKPQFFYDYLNSITLEFGEVGRIAEAGNISKILLASPYVNAYPEWRETANEIALRGYKSRSVISFKLQKPENLLRLPERERSESIKRSLFYQPSDVTKITDWKNKMVKENGDDKDKEELSDRQMVMKIMEYATDDDLPDEALHQMLEAVKKISYSFKSKKGDDKDD